MSRPVVDEESDEEEALTDAQKLLLLNTLSRGDQNLLYSIPKDGPSFGVGELTRDKASLGYKKQATSSSTLPPSFTDLQQVTNTGTRQNMNRTKNQSSKGASKESTPAEDVVDYVNPYESSLNRSNKPSLTRRFRRRRVSRHQEDFGEDWVVAKSRIVNYGSGGALEEEDYELGVRSDDDGVFYPSMETRRVGDLHLFSRKRSENEECSSNGSEKVFTSLSNSKDQGISSKLQVPSRKRTSSDPEEYRNIFGVHPRSRLFKKKAKGVSVGVFTCHHSNTNKSPSSNPSSSSSHTSKPSSSSIHSSKPPSSSLHTSKPSNSSPYTSKPSMNGIRLFSKGKYKDTHRRVSRLNLSDDDASSSIAHHRRGTFLSASSSPSSPLSTSLDTATIGDLLSLPHQTPTHRFLLRSTHKLTVGELKLLRRGVPSSISNSMTMDLLQQDAQVQDILKSVTVKELKRLHRRQRVSSVDSEGEEKDPLNDSPLYTRKHPRNTLNNGLFTFLREIPKDIHPTLRMAQLPNLTSTSQRLYTSKVDSLNVGDLERVGKRGLLSRVFDPNTTVGELRLMSPSKLSLPQVAYLEEVDRLSVQDLSRMDVDPGRGMGPIPLGIPQSITVGELQPGQTSSQRRFSSQVDHLTVGDLRMLGPHSLASTGGLEDGITLKELRMMQPSNLDQTRFVFAVKNTPVRDLRRRKATRKGPGDKKGVSFKESSQEGLAFLDLSLSKGGVKGSYSSLKRPMPSKEGMGGSYSSLCRPVGSSSTLNGPVLSSPASSQPKVGELRMSQGINLGSLSSTGPNVGDLKMSQGYNQDTMPITGPSTTSGLNVGDLKMSQGFNQGTMPTPGPSTTSGPYVGDLKMSQGFNQGTIPSIGPSTTSGPNAGDLKMTQEYNQVNLQSPASTSPLLHLPPSLDTDTTVGQLRLLSPSRMDPPQKAYFQAVHEISVQDLSVLSRFSPSSLVFEPASTLAQLHAIPESSLSSTQRVFMKQVESLSTRELELVERYKHANTEGYSANMSLDHLILVHHPSRNHIQRAQLQQVDSIRIQEVTNQILPSSHVVDENLAFGDSITLGQLRKMSKEGMNEVQLEQVDMLKGVTVGQLSLLRPEMEEIASSTHLQQNGLSSTEYKKGKLHRNKRRKGKHTKIDVSLSSPPLSSSNPPSYSSTPSFSSSIPLNTHNNLSNTQGYPSSHLSSIPQGFTPVLTVQQLGMMSTQRMNPRQQQFLQTMDSLSVEDLTKLSSLPKQSGFASSMTVGELKRTDPASLSVPQQAYVQHVKELRVDELIHLHPPHPHLPQSNLHLIPPGFTSKTTVGQLKLMSTRRMNPQQREYTHYIDGLTVHQLSSVASLPKQPGFGSFVTVGELKRMEPSNLTPHQQEFIQRVGELRIGELKVLDSSTRSLNSIDPSGTYTQSSKRAITRVNPSKTSTQPSTRAFIRVNPPSHKFTTLQQPVLQEIPSGIAPTTTIGELKLMSPSSMSASQQAYSTSVDALTVGHLKQLQTPLSSLDTSGYSNNTTIKQLRMLTKTSKEQHELLRQVQGIRVGELRGLMRVQEGDHVESKGVPFNQDVSFNPLDKKGVKVVELSMVSPMKGSVEGHKSSGVGTSSGLPVQGELKMFSSSHSISSQPSSISFSTFLPSSMNVNALHQHLSTPSSSQVQDPPSHVHYTPSQRQYTTKVLESVTVGHLKQVLPPSTFPDSLTVGQLHLMSPAKLDKGQRDFVKQVESLSVYDLEKLVPVDGSSTHHEGVFTMDRGVTTQQQLYMGTATRLHPTRLQSSHLTPTQLQPTQLQPTQLQRTTQLQPTQLHPTNNQHSLVLPIPASLSPSLKVGQLLEAESITTPQQAYLDHVLSLTLQDIRPLHLSPPSNLPQHTTIHDLVSSSSLNQPQRMFVSRLQQVPLSSLSSLSSRRKHSQTNSLLKGGGFKDTLTVGELKLASPSKLTQQQHLYSSSLDQVTVGELKALSSMQSLASQGHNLSSFDDRTTVGQLKMMQAGTMDRDQKGFVEKVSALTVGDLKMLSSDESIHPSSLPHSVSPTNALTVGDLKMLSSDKSMHPSSLPHSVSTTKLLYPASQSRTPSLSLTKLLFPPSQSILPPLSFDKATTFGEIKQLKSLTSPQRSYLVSIDKSINVGHLQQVQGLEKAPFPPSTTFQELQLVSPSTKQEEAYLLKVDRVSVGQLDLLGRHHSLGARNASTRSGYVDPISTQSSTLHLPFSPSTTLHQLHEIPNLSNAQLSFSSKVDALSVGDLFKLGQDLTSPLEKKGTQGILTRDVYSKGQKKASLHISPGKHRLMKSGGFQSNVTVGELRRIPVNQLNREQQHFLKAVDLVTVEQVATILDKSGVSESSSLRLPSKRGLYMVGTQEHAGSASLNGKGTGVGQFNTIHKGMGSTVDSSSMNGPNVGELKMSQSESLHNPSLGTSFGTSVDPNVSELKMSHLESLHSTSLGNSFGPNVGELKMSQSEGLRNPSLGPNVGDLKMSRGFNQGIPSTGPFTTSGPNVGDLKMTQEYNQSTIPSIGPSTTSGPNVGDLKMSQSEYPQEVKRNQRGFAGRPSSNLFNTHTDQNGRPIVMKSLFGRRGSVRLTYSRSDRSSHDGMDEAAQGSRSLQESEGPTSFFPPFLSSPSQSNLYVSQSSQDHLQSTQYLPQSTQHHPQSIHTTSPPQSLAEEARLSFLRRHSSIDMSTVVGQQARAHLSFLKPRLNVSTGDILDLSTDSQTLVPEDRLNSSYGDVDALKGLLRGPTKSLRQVKMDYYAQRLSPTKLASSSPSKPSSPPRKNLYSSSPPQMNLSSSLTQDLTFVIPPPPPPRSLPFAPTHLIGQVSTSTLLSPAQLQYKHLLHQVSLQELRQVPGLHTSLLKFDPSLTIGQLQRVRDQPVGSTQRRKLLTMIDAIPIQQLAVISSKPGLRASKHPHSSSSTQQHSSFKQLHPHSSSSTQQHSSFTQLHPLLPPSTQLHLLLSTKRPLNPAEQDALDVFHQVTIGEVKRLGSTPSKPLQFASTDGMTMEQLFFKAKGRNPLSADLQKVVEKAHKVTVGHLDTVLHQRQTTLAHLDSSESSLDHITVAQLRSFPGLYKGFHNSQTVGELRRGTSPE